MQPEDQIVDAERASPGPLGDAAADDMSQPFARWAPRSLTRGMGNVVVLGLAFLLLYLALNITQNFATSLHGSLGYIEFAVLNFSFALSTLVAPSFISVVGEKITMMLSAALFVPFATLNMVHNAAVLIPCAVLNGIGAGFLWSAQGSVFVSFSSSKETIGYYSGIFFAILQVHQLIGNLSAQVILNSVGKVGLFCLLGACATLAIPMFLPLSIPICVGKSKKKQESFKTRILSTAARFAEKRMLMIVPIVIFHGTCVPFMYGIFPALAGKAFLGYVMTVFGVFNIIMSLSSGILADKFGKKPVTILGVASVVLSTVFAFIIRRDSPNPADSLSLMAKIMLFVTAGLLGTLDGVMNTIQFGIIGLLYPENSTSAFAARTLTISLTCAIWFFGSAYVPFLPMMILVDSLGVMTIVDLFILDKFVHPVDAWRAPKASPAIEEVGLVNATAADMPSDPEEVQTDRP